MKEYGDKIAILYIAVYAFRACFRDDNDHHSIGLARLSFTSPSCFFSHSVKRAYLIM